jgi:hypothetical protein
MSCPMEESPEWMERLLGSSGDLGIFRPLRLCFRTGDSRKLGITSRTFKRTQRRESGGTRLFAR